MAMTAISSSLSYTMSPPPERSTKLSKVLMASFTPHFCSLRKLTTTSAIYSILPSRAQHQYYKWSRNMHLMSSVWSLPPPLQPSLTVDPIQGARPGYTNTEKDWNPGKQLKMAQQHVARAGPLQRRLPGTSSKTRSPIWTLRPYAYLRSTDS